MELQMGVLGLLERETGTKGVAMATKWQVSFCFFCDVQYWCKVWRPLFQYFGRYAWFSILLFMWNHLWRHPFPHLHNTKTWISLKRKMIFQKGKCHSSWLWKPFQKSSNYFLLHRHFKDKWQMFCFYLAAVLRVWAEEFLGTQYSPPA